VMRPNERDADGCGEGDVPVRQRVRRGDEMVNQLSHTPRAAAVSIARDEHVKLLDTEARHRIVRPEALADALAGRAHQPACGHCAEARLDAGDAVELEPEERVDCARLGSGLLQRLLESGYELLLLQALGGGSLPGLASFESMQWQLRIRRWG